MKTINELKGEIGRIAYKIERIEKKIAELEQDFNDNVREYIEIGHYHVSHLADEYSFNRRELEENKAEYIKFHDKLAYQLACRMSEQSRDEFRQLEKGRS